MQPVNESGYVSLFQEGELGERKDRLYELLEPCELCPRHCGVNRQEKAGFCGGKWLVKVASYAPHFGEEPELVGLRGSGTIFFSGCNLKCDYCQNFDISHLEYGDEVTSDELANIMLSLQKLGCHNINIVTPTHFTPQLVEALIKAVPKGLHLPLVYNCGGYESLSTIELLEGMVDIYMPDIKYGNSQIGEKYSHIPDYFEVAKEALKEMQRQVGDLIEKDGLAQKGLLIRHLVLPNQQASPKEVLDFIAEELSKNSYVNIMDQYRPLYKAKESPLLARPITSEEYREVVQYAQSLGLSRGFRTTPELRYF